MPSVWARSQQPPPRNLKDSASPSAPPTQSDPRLAPYLVPGAPHDGGEDGPGGIVPREAGFAHAGAVVDHERSNIVIHGELQGEQGREPGSGAAAPALPTSGAPRLRAARGRRRAPRLGTKEARPAALLP